MAIVDSLLRLVTVRGAQALVLRAGQVPFLDFGDREAKLSMPVPGADIVQGILRDVASDADRELLEQSGALASSYRCDETTFAVRVDKTDGGYHFAFRLSGDASSLEPAPVAAPLAAGHTAPLAVGHAAPVAAGLAPPVAAGLAPPLVSAAPNASPSAALAPRERARGARVPYREAAGELSVVQVLERGAALDASDILVSTGAPPRLRVGGAMRALGDTATGAEALQSFFGAVLGEEQQQELDTHGSADVAVNLDGRRYRVNVFQQLNGLAAAFRPINRAVPTLESLHLPEDFVQLTRFRSGLVLMVGTAGSGKSTTLVALIEHINRTQPKHVITLEDPIEYTYEPREALIHQREVGRHVTSFASGLRAALRESPDVILVGEMRDHATISAALTAAETGHLVLSTLHSGSADMAIHRIVDVFPQHQQEQVRHQLADVLRAVVTQHLLPSTRPPQRVPAIERLMVTSAVATKVRENRCHQIGTELQRGREDGMIPLELSLARLVKDGLVTMRVAHDLADDPTLLEQLAR